jgi:hypothetical protein
VKYLDHFYIGGQFVSAEGRTKRSVISPVTEEQVGTISMGPPKMWTVLPARHLTVSKPKLARRIRGLLQVSESSFLLTACVE